MNIFQLRKEAGKSKTLHPLDIDAHWLQRRLSKYFDDATISQQKSKDVLEILRNSENDRECETHLVLLLGYDCFEFIKILVKNRDMVLYCTLLLTSQTDQEKEKLIESMKKKLNLKKILDQLEGEDEDDTSNLRSAQDAKKQSSSKGASDLEGDNAEVLSLDDLAFTNGSHFMANKRCQLPEGSFRKQEKGYEEVHVPALKPKSFADDEQVTTTMIESAFEVHCNLILAVLVSIDFHVLFQIVSL